MWQKKQNKINTDNLFYCTYGEVSKTLSINPKQTFTLITTDEETDSLLSNTSYELMKCY